MSIYLTPGLASSAVGNVKSVPALDPVLPGSNDSNSGADTSAEAQRPSRELLNQAVASIRADVQSVHRNLEFSVDEESGIPIVKVVATDSGMVIRQIPSEVAVKLAESLKESSNLLFSEKV